MNRLLAAIVLAVALSGCSAAPEEKLDVLADGVIGMYAAITPAASPAVIPEPPPPTSDCPNCKGSGRLGDGTVSVTCPACKGTGSVGSSGAQEDRPPAVTPPPRPAPRTYSQPRFFRR